MVHNKAEDIDKNPMWSSLELEERIGLNEWHSFCTSLDLQNKSLTMVQNGKTIVIKEYEMTEDPKRLTSLMPWVYLGCHTGSIADVQVSSRPLVLEEMKKWTLCEDDNKVNKLELIGQ